LLKFVYVPAASTAQNRLLFLLRPFTVLMKKTRAIKQSSLDVYVRRSTLLSLPLQLVFPAQGIADTPFYP